MSVLKSSLKMITTLMSMSTADLPNKNPDVQESALGNSSLDTFLYIKL